MRIVCQQTILMQYHALFGIYDKALLTLLIIGVILNQTWPAFYDYDLCMKDASYTPMY